MAYRKFSGACSWRAKIIFRGDRYTLRSVETDHNVWILLDPAHGADEYFIVENRWGGNSYDQQMSDNGGLAVWHVMENSAVYESHIPPTPPNPPPSSRQDLWVEKWATIGGDWGRRGIWMIRPIWNTADDSQALWDGAQLRTDYDLLSENPDPSLAELHWADGSPSGFSLRSISAAGAQMEATIEVPDTP